MSNVRLVLCGIMAPAMAAKSSAETTDQALIGRAIAGESAAVSVLLARSDHDASRQQWLESLLALWRMRYGAKIKSKFFYSLVSAVRSCKIDSTEIDTMAEDFWGEVHLRLTRCREHNSMLFRAVAEGAEEQLLRQWAGWRALDAAKRLRGSWAPVDLGQDPESFLDMLTAPAAIQRSSHLSESVWDAFVQVVRSPIQPNGQPPPPVPWMIVFYCDAHGAANARDLATEYPRKTLADLLELVRNERTNVEHSVLHEQVRTALLTQLARLSPYRAPWRQVRLGVILEVEERTLTGTSRAGVQILEGWIAAVRTAILRRLQPSENDRKVAERVRALQRDRIRYLRRRWLEYDAMPAALLTWALRKIVLYHESAAPLEDLTQAGAAGIVVDAISHLDRESTRIAEMEGWLRQNPEETLGTAAARLRQPLDSMVEKEENRCRGRRQRGKES